MRVLMLFAGVPNLSIPKLFVESGWEVLVFEEGVAGGATNGSMELLNEWRTHLSRVDLVICDSPTLLFKYHEAADDSSAPVLYMESIVNRAAVARLVRGISPLEQDLILSLMTLPMDVPVHTAPVKKRRWWRRNRG